MIPLASLCLAAAFTAAPPLVTDDFRQFDRRTWTCNTRANLSVVADGQRPAVLQYQADYGQATYAGMQKKLAPSVDLSRWNALRISVRSDDTPAMTITLMSYEGHTESKFSREIPLKPQWREYTLFFTEFKDRDIDTPINLEQLRRVRAVMFVTNRRKATARVLLDQLMFLSAVPPVQSEEDKPRARLTARHRADIDVLKQRFTSIFLPNYQERIPAPSAQAVKLVATLSADGSWPDVNYDDKSLTGWSPTLHLDRLWSLTTEYVRLKPAGPARAALKDAIDRGLAFWFRRDPQSHNWWYNRIGAQQRFSKIGLLLDDELTPEQRAGIVKILRRSTTVGATGENLVWTAGNTVVRGILERSPAVCAAAFEKIADEIRVAPDVDEGVKADGTFLQHGQQLYNGGYGAGFAVDTSRFLYYAANTAYQFPKDKVDIVTSYILDGSRWMVYRNMPDYSTRGRDITRVARPPGPCYLAAACQQLKESPGPRQAEVAAFLDELNQGENSLAGNKHFWHSDYMTHRRPGWMMSVKMLSSRMQSGEVGDGEGLRSHLLSDGVTYLYSGDGLAYHNVFPVWDWKRLPGITAAWSPAPPEGQVASFGNSDFAGGVSDGTFGACAFILQRGNLKARKAWFFFDHECVALGAGIESGLEPAYTSLEQNLLSGDATVCDGGRVYPLAGELNSQNIRWVHHRDVGYFLLQKARVTARAAPQTGSWQNISRGGSRAPLSRDLFSLYIDHGPGARGASYQYLVAPMKAAACKAYAAALPVRVLVNTADTAAVEHIGLGIVQAAFFGEGTVTASDGLTLGVDKPCLLMCRKDRGKLIISAANPLNQPATLGITVNAELTGTGAVWQRSRAVTKIRLDLPDGEFAGQTASASFMLKAPLRAGSKRKPAASQYRTWTSAGGTYHVEAELAGVASGEVTLRKRDGTEIVLPLERLSAEDQAWVGEHKPKAESGEPKAETR